MSERSGDGTWFMATVITLLAMTLSYGLGDFHGRRHQPRTALVIPGGCQSETFKDGRVFWLCMGPSQ